MTSANPVCFTLIRRVDDPDRSYWVKVNNPNWIKTFPEFNAKQTLIEFPSIPYIEYQTDAVYRIIPANREKEYSLEEEPF